MRLSSFVSCRLVASALALSAATLSFGAYANITLDNAHQTVNQDTREIWFSGTITITQDWVSLSMPVPHLFRQPGWGDRLDSSLNAPAFLTWLGNFGSHQAGATYTGDFFSLHQDIGDPTGVYDHTGASAVPPANFYMEFNQNQSSYGRSNEVPFSVTVVPEPATMAALGLGVVTLIRRKRK